MIGPAGGHATWSFFAAHETATIVDFVRATCPGADPIHVNFDFTDADLQRLAKEHGIRPTIIEQYPGTDCVGACCSCTPPVFQPCFVLVLLSPQAMPFLSPSAAFTLCKTMLEMSSLLLV